MTENPNTAADAAERVDDTALREWLDNRQAEVERDHRDGWTGRSCYCDMPKPCVDRAYELSVVEGLRALLTDRARTAAELATRAANTEQSLSNQNTLLDHKDQVIAALRLELEQARGERAAVETWLGRRIGALRKVLRDERDTTRAARAEVESLRQELDEAASIVMEIGEVLNSAELYCAIGDLAQLFAPRTAVLAEREEAAKVAPRPADATAGTGEDPTLSTPAHGTQQGAEGDGEVEV